MKASIVFYPHEAKKNAVNGLIPIYLRICFRRNKVESRLNSVIHFKDLSRWDPITMRLLERNCALNNYLNSFEQRFNEFVFANPTTLSNFSAANIRDYVLGVSNVKKIKLLDFVNDYFEKAVMNNVNCTQGTIKNYRKAVNHIKAFIKSKKLEEMLLDNLDFEFASDFKNYLVTSNPAAKRIGMMEISAATIIKKFRTIFTHAVDKGLAKTNPFKLVKIKTKFSRRERLTVEQVQKIYSSDLRHWPALDLCRDLFLFSVFTGLAYHDAMSITRANLEIKNDGNLKLKINRQKTDVITESFLPIQAVDIINKYQNMTENQHINLLPFRTNQEINRQLKKLAEKTKIFRLSTHVARHTFRQLLAEAGIVDMAVVRRMMGQTGKGDIDEVYYSVTETALLKAKNKYQYLLNSSLNEISGNDGEPSL